MTRQFWKTTCGTLKWLWSLDSRTAEWTIGNVLLSRAIALFHSPQAYDGDAYRSFHFMPTWLWAAFYLVLAVAIYTAICYNGRNMRTPAIRVVAQLIASTVLLLHAAVFFKYGFPPVMGWLYATMAFSASYSALNIASKMPKRREPESV